jgi:factor associated with neutral sphingomyelinase activation
MFELRFASVTQFLTQLQSLMTSCKTMEKDAHDALAASSIAMLEAHFRFDHSLLVDVSERKVAELTVSRVTPLVMEPGCLLLTSERLYFAPFANVSAEPATIIEASAILRAIPRRFQLQHVGLELFVKPRSRGGAVSVPSNSPGAAAPPGATTGTGGHSWHTQEESLFIMFDDEAERNRFRDALSRLEGATRLREAGSTASRLQHATHRWRHGLLSNFDYLLELNELADRTRNDLTQYPIFPWVLSDYSSDTLDLDDPSVYRDLSKPVGALNETRLRSFRERLMAIMVDDERFMYGTHYSTPGYVLYYLVRSRPELMLRLQNGKFDAPDRLFDSIADTWQGVLSSPTDVKELIPEFYDTESAEAGQFLLNGRHLELGQRSDGRALGDVRLPPWATDAKDFVTKMRQALESPHVTAQLPRWIDLIFGSKQRGLAAELADNLFHPVTYDGGAQLEREVDPLRRRALQAQIREFGQTPAQLFFESHPTRLPGTSGGPAEGEGGDEAGTAGPDDAWWTRLADAPTPVTLLSTKAHRGPILDLAALGGGSVTPDFAGSDVATVGEDGLLKVFRVADDGTTVTQRRAVSLSDMALSGVAEVRENTLLVSSWSNGLFVYSIDFGRVVDAMESAHDDAIAGLATSRAVRSAATVSWDCSVRLWQWREDGTLDRVPVWDSLEALDDEGRCITLGGPGGDSLIVAGARDGTVAMCDVRAGPAPVRVFQPFESLAPGVAVASLSLAEDGRHLVATGAGDDDTQAGGVSLVDLGMGSILATHATPAASWASAVHSTTSRSLAATGAGDGALSLWSTADPSAALRTQEHTLTGGIRSMGRGAGGLFLGGVEGELAWCRVEKGEDE